MTESTRSALLVGGAGRSLSHLEAPLERFAFDVARVADLELAIVKVSATRFDVVIAETAGDDEAVRRLAAAMRATGGVSTTSGLIVLVSEDHLHDLGRLVGRGVNRVLSTRESPEVVALVANRLGLTRHSLAQRYPIRLEVSCEVGGSWHSWTTENLSASGMLIRTDAVVSPSTRFRFRLTTPAGPIEGEAKVVRVTSAGREPVSGIGVRLASLDGDGRRRLAGVLLSLSQAAKPTS